MNEIFAKEVAVDGPVVNEGERSSSTVSTGQGPLVGPLERGQRWTVRRKQGAVECGNVTQARRMTNLCPGNRVRYTSYTNHMARRPETS